MQAELGKERCLSFTWRLVVYAERLSLLNTAFTGPWQAEPIQLVNMLILFASYAAWLRLIGKLHTNLKEWHPASVGPLSLRYRYILTSQDMSGVTTFIRCASLLPNSALCRHQSCFRAWLSFQPKKSSWNLITGTLTCLRKKGRESGAPWSGRPFRTESLPYVLIQRRFVQEENPEAERGWSPARKAMASWFILSPFRKSYQDSESAVNFCFGWAGSWRGRWM